MGCGGVEAFIGDSCAVSIGILRSESLSFVCVGGAVDTGSPLAPQLQRRARAHSKGSGTYPEKKKKVLCALSFHDSIIAHSRNDGGGLAPPGAPILPETLRAPGVPGRRSCRDGPVRALGNSDRHAQLRAEHVQRRMYILTYVNSHVVPRPELRRAGLRRTGREGDH